MSDQLAIEVVKLLGDVLKKNGAMEAKLNSLEPAHYNLLKQVEMLTQSRDAIQNQRDRAQEEMRKMVVKAETVERKATALHGAATDLLTASRGFKTLHPLGEKLKKALTDAQDIIDEIPF